MKKKYEKPVGVVGLCEHFRELGVNSYRDCLLRWRSVRSVPKVSSNLKMVVYNSQLFNPLVRCNQGLEGKSEKWYNEISEGGSSDYYDRLKALKKIA